MLRIINEKLLQDNLGTSGGDIFEQFIRDIIRENCRINDIPLSAVHYDYRTSCPDGGIDILIEEANRQNKTGFIPSAPSIWSVKSGKDGISVTTLKNELNAKKHKELINKLKNGYIYKWCALQSISNPQRNKMRMAADEVAKRFKLKKEQIQFCWIDHLAEYANQHLNISKQYLPSINYNFYTIDEWLARCPDKKELKSTWIDVEGRNDLKKRIAGHLSDNDKKMAVFHLAGLSGIGKTRTALQACLDSNDLKDTLYSPCYSDISKFLSQYVKEDGCYLRIIIDEVILEDYFEIENTYKDYGDRLRIVTIGPAKRDNLIESGASSLWLLKEPTEEIIQSFVKSIEPNFDNTIIRNIQEYSGHDFRLALLLIASFKQDPQKLPILQIDHLLDRIQNLFHKHIGYNEFKELYGILSTAIDIGISSDFRQEIEFLASFFECKATQLDKATGDCNSCGLGIKTKRFFEASPRALALRVFQDCTWKIIENRADEFLENIPSDRLRRRFIERCQELPQMAREEVMDRIGRFFIKHFGDDITALFNNEKTRVFTSWTELDPKRGLLWLKKIILAAQDEQIKALDGFYVNGGWNSRRHIVWLCEHLACFSENFWDCEEILFRLAQCETETKIGNNSTCVWQSLFLPVLSNTEVPFEDRFKLLKKRLKSITSETINLILDAAFGVFDSHRYRMLPPRVVGGRLVPNEWRPLNREKLEDLKTSAGGKILSIISEMSKELYEIALNKVIEKFYLIVDSNLVRETRTIIDKRIINDEQKLALRHRLDRILTKHKGSDVEEIKKWREKLDPENLRDKIIDITSRDYWSVHFDLNPGSEIEKIDAFYETIAIPLLNEPDQIKTLSEWFGSDRCRSGKRFAYVLGLKDKEQIFVPIVANWIKTKQAIEFCAFYLQGIWKQENNLPQSIIEILDEEIAKQPKDVLLISILSDFTDMGFNRIIKCLTMLPQEDITLLNYFYGSFWDEILGIERKQLLLAEMEKKGAVAYVTALQLLAGWIEYGKKPIPAELSMIAMRIMSGIVQTDIQPFAEFEWKGVCEKLISYYPKEIADMICEVIAQGHAGAYDDYAEEIFIILAKQNSLIAMEAIGKRILDAKNVTFHIKTFSELFESIDIAIFKEWVEKNGVDAAIRVARHLKSPYLDQKGNAVVPERTDWLLTKYGDNERVFREFCIGRHSLEVHCGKVEEWGGEIRKTLDAFNSSRKKWATKWIKYETDMLEMEKRWEEDSEEEFERT